MFSISLYSNSVCLSVRCALTCPEGSKALGALRCTKGSLDSPWEWKRLNLSSLWVKELKILLRLSSSVEVSIACRAWAASHPRPRHVLHRWHERRFFSLRSERFERLEAFLFIVFSSFFHLFQMIFSQAPWPTGPPCSGFRPSSWGNELSRRRGLFCMAFIHIQLI